MWAVESSQVWPSYARIIWRSKPSSNPDQLLSYWASTLWASTTKKTHYGLHVILIDYLCSFLFFIGDYLCSKQSQRVARIWCGIR
jgi:hypothetical protein